MAGPPFTIDNTTPAPTQLVSAYPSNEVLNRTNILNWLTWLSNPTTGLMNDQAFKPGQIFPAGSITNMLFYQATAPTGWTQVTSVNDATIRLVNNGSTGGTFQGLYGFTTLYGPTVTLNVSSVALTVSQLPIHNHTVSGTTGVESAPHQHNVSVTGATDVQGDHVHAMPYGVVSAGGSAGSGVVANAGSSNTGVAGAHGHNVSASGTTAGELQQHTHSFTTTTDNTGSGSTHNHSFALNVIFADVIICTRT